MNRIDKRVEYPAVGDREFYPRRNQSLGTLALWHRRIATMNDGAFVNVDMAVPEELSVDGNHKHACEVACRRRMAFTTRPQGYVRWQTPSASVRRVESSGACSDGPTFWLGANSLELRPGRIAAITESRSAPPAPIAAWPWPGRASSSARRRRPRGRWCGIGGWLL